MMTMMFSALRQRDDHLVALSPEKRHHVWQEEARGRAVLHGGGRDHDGLGKTSAHARQGRPRRRAGRARAATKAEAGLQGVLRQGMSAGGGGSLSEF